MFAGGVLMFSMPRFAKPMLLTLAIGASSTHASLVTLIGTDFDVRYDDSLLSTSLFGTPYISGNTLFFTPVNFKAQSTSAERYATADSTINLQLLAHAGQQISAVSLIERGDYRLLGAQSFVEVTGQIRLFDLDRPLNEDTATIVASGPMTQADGVVHNWQSGAQIQTQGNPLLAGASNYNLTIQNILGAYTSSAETGAPVMAFIQKKNVIGNVSVSVTAVPEPATWVMAMAGLLLIPIMARRR
jgi:hypothetical protein